MNRRFAGPMKTLALMLVALITAICAVTIAQVAMADADMADCSSHVCDERLACGTSAQPHALRPSPPLPTAIFASIDGLVTPAPMANRLTPASVDVGPAHSVVPLAPRSPPVA